MTFSSSGISLFVGGLLERDFLGNSRLEIAVSENGGKGGSWNGRQGNLLKLGGGLLQVNTGQIIDNHLNITL